MHRGVDASFNILIRFSFSITYPAISSFVSMHADADKQGLVQGMITGVRGLCNGLGPAMFGLIFSLFHVDLNEKVSDNGSSSAVHRQPTPDLTLFNQSLAGGDGHDEFVAHIIPGPPFVFGALLVIVAPLVAAFIPDIVVSSGTGNNPSSGSLLGTGGSGGNASRRLHHQYHHHHHDDIFKKSDDDLSDGEYTVPLMEKGGNLL